MVSNIQKNNTQIILPFCQQPKQDRNNHQNNITRSNGHNLICRIFINVELGSRPCCDGHYGCSPFTPDGKAHPNMCCDPWGTHNNNRPWDQKYIGYIDNVKKACPEVYAWQFDDFHSTINCRKTDGLVDYKLTICP